jgi:exodeoxyribonuclease V alpha subunit
MREPNSGRFFSALDRHFGRFIAGFQPGGNAAVELAAALLSRAAGNGDVCLDLPLTAGSTLADARRALPEAVCPALDRWVAALRASPAVGAPGQRRPLILDDRLRLYLYRYWEYENTLALAIRARLVADPGQVDLSRLRDGLQRVFGSEPRRSEDSGQRLAAAVAGLQRFSVITGGPGTGKTFTIARLLEVLAEIHAQRPLRTRLAAPTGKAAARLRESLQTARTLPGNRAAAAGALEVHTVHRLLQPIPHSPYFRHHASNPLPADLVVVDEASMVDLALMAKLLDAVPAQSRIVLVGDKDQLASVEAGSVLGDICRRDRRPGVSAHMAARLREVAGLSLEAVANEASGLQDAIVELSHNYRFAAGSALAELSRAVNRGDGAQALEVLADAPGGDLVWLDPQRGPAVRRDLEHRILDGYRDCLRDLTPQAVLKEHARFKVLCAHRIGVSGVDALNRLAEQLLYRNRLIPAPGAGQWPWYAGRPVLVTRNDYTLDLFNGDIGVALPEGPAGGGGLRVHFGDGRGGIRRFLPQRLPEHETVYAMTVHKSQGSEFEDVLLVLPERDSPVLTRELIYTALTRARRRMILWGARPVLENAIRRRIERSSGLQEALWGKP